jgi:hypothetical protein
MESVLEGNTHSARFGFRRTVSSPASRDIDRWPTRRYSRSPIFQRIAGLGGPSGRNQPTRFLVGRRRPDRAAGTRTARLMLKRETLSIRVHSGESRPMGCYEFHDVPAGRYQFRRTGREWGSTARDTNDFQIDIRWLDWNTVRYETVEVSRPKTRLASA